MLDRRLVRAAIANNQSGYLFSPGAGQTEWFADAADAPEMVIVPTGSFTMGGSDFEASSYRAMLGGMGALKAATELPSHLVTFNQPFAIGRHTVTRAQFEVFAKDMNLDAHGALVMTAERNLVKDPDASWRNPGFSQHDAHPAVCASWHDAQAYCAWLAARTGEPYRLPTEAEWEYAARAGSMTPYWWGSTITPEQANYDHAQQGTVPVGTFLPNPWGLFNVHGNVSEWCEDVWHQSYAGAPSDGSAWLEGGNADHRVCRGGAWSSFPIGLSSAARGEHIHYQRLCTTGFRIVRSLPPPSQ